MRLHGAGIWGCSSANRKGAKRIKCPVCGEWFVKGSRNRHNENYMSYEDVGKMGIRLVVLDEPKGTWECPNRK